MKHKPLIIYLPFAKWQFKKKKYMKFVIFITP